MATTFRRFTHTSTGANDGYVVALRSVGAFAARGRAASSVSKPPTTSLLQTRAMNTSIVTRGLDQVGRLLRKVTSDDVGRATPCAEWIPRGFA